MFKQSDVATKLICIVISFCGDKPPMDGALYLCINLYDEGVALREITGDRNSSSFNPSTQTSK
jgi:hypothetical protein